MALTGAAFSYNSTLALTVQTPEEYGRYMLQQSASSGFDEDYNTFSRTQIYGERLFKMQDSQFNDFGYVAY